MAGLAAARSNSTLLLWRELADASIDPAPITVVATTPQTTASCLRFMPNSPWVGGADSDAGRSWPAPRSTPAIRARFDSASAAGHPGARAPALGPSAGLAVHVGVPLGLSHPTERPLRRSTPGRFKVA